MQEGVPTRQSSLYPFFLKDCEDGEEWEQAIVRLLSLHLPSCCYLTQLRTHLSTAYNLTQRELPHTLQKRKRKILYSPRDPLSGRGHYQKMPANLSGLAWQRFEFASLTS